MQASPMPFNDNSHLASRNSRSRNDVGLEVVVDVGSVARVGRLDVSGNLSSGRQGFGATAGDLELGASNVELGRGAGVVDAELLDAEKVLASGDARWDVDRVCSYETVSSTISITWVSLKMKGMRTAQIPLGLSATEGRANLLDLRPVRATISRLGAVHLGHVEADRTLVVHSLIGSERHRGTSSHGHGGGARAGSTTNIAAEIFGAEIGDGAVVVCVLADVLVQRALGTVGCKGLEDVCAALGVCIW